MNIFQTFKDLRSLVPKSISQQKVSGVPENISFDLLNELCKKYKGSTIKQVQYIHLSGWKRSCAYRLFIRTNSNQYWQLIFKNACYSLCDIPALNELPIRPGPSEYAVYSSQLKTLKDYLPKVYFSNECQKGVHYQYILEDLYSEYHKILSTTSYVKAIDVLMLIQDSLSKEVNTDLQPYFINYDAVYRSKIVKYINTSLYEYVNTHTSSLVSKQYDELSEILAMYASFSLPKKIPYKYVHGDFNLANIFVHKTQTKFKIIDWEWAGKAIPHFDVAAFLKRANPDVEKLVLLRWAELNREYTFSEHKKIYEWCQLERGLLDSAFLAKQLKNESYVDTRFSLYHYIDASYSRVCSAYKWLSRKV